ncbi:hypothetical protein Q8G37_04045 [Bacillus wiedmannii]|uniref:hypothetical protein n=1 Tax=Bacillus wiedmannii TaxID=1890302 RepID=UPI00273218B5|nr:hypothetical protein [Bacillus wiedmannii]MDP1455674.1 hypothetical protein [Bacillus wiedmannii]
MRKISGYLSILGDNERRTVAVSDSGEMLKFMLNMEWHYKEIDRDCFGPNHYLPSGDDHKDLIAIVFTAEMMLDDMELEGEWPAEEGDVIFNEA